MSYSVLNNNSPNGKITYLADSIDDLAVIKETNPSMGTSVLVLEENNSKVYILNSQKEWVMI